MHPSERLAKRIGLEKHATGYIFLWKGKALPVERLFLVGIPSGGVEQVT